MTHFTLLENSGPENNQLTPLERNCLIYDYCRISNNKKGIKVRARGMRKHFPKNLTKNF